MNRQAIYDKAAKHLLTQMKRSYSPKVGCAYRGADNTMCAIGCLIPNKLYRKRMENTNVGSVLKMYPHIALHLNVEDSYDELFLTHLQRVHDGNSPQHWLIALTKFAKTYNLEPVTVVDGQALLDNINAAFDAALGGKS